MNKIIIFIEAVGKIRSLQRSLNALEIDADIIATKGHLYANSQHLFPVGINEHFEETGRQAVNQKLIDKIKSTSGMYRHYLIATDPDQEGDVIAEDIANLIPEQKLLRVNLHGLDADSIYSALKTAKAYNPELSWPGTCRRILDRVLGASFTNQFENISVGRVQSALLGAIHEKPQVFGVANLAMKDKLSGHDFECEIEVTHANHASIKRIVESLKTNPLSASVKLNQDATASEPWNYAECVFYCAQRLNASIAEVDTAMQKLYEDGLLSYLRSSAKALSKDALACLSNIANSQSGRHQLQVDRVQIISQHDAHESPRPLGLVDISLPLKLMDFNTAVLTMITRNLVRCGTEGVDEIPDTSSLPEWAQSLPWKRTRYATLSWRDSKPKNEITLMAIDVALLGVMNRYQLGRPGTQVDHVQRFMQKKLVHSDLNLTTEGKRWVSKTHPQFLSPKNSAYIENLIADNADLPPSVRAAWIVKELGPQVSETALSTIQMKTQHNSRAS